MKNFGVWFLGIFSLRLARTIQLLFVFIHTPSLWFAQTKYLYDIFWSIYLGSDLTFNQFLSFSSSIDALNAKHVISLVHYQEVLSFVFGIILPVLYIGSSAELRKDLDLIRRYVFRTRGDVEQTRHEIYSIPNMWLY